MKVLMWLLLLGAIAGVAYMLRSWRQRWLERERASEDRLASFIAQARPKVPAVEPTTPQVEASLRQEKLLFEAATKAGEAGEAVLSIQLYARLIARYPESALGAQARAAVQAQKAKLATPKAPGTSGPG
jgi:hypothetical protein